MYHDYRRAAIVAVFTQQMRTDEDNFPFSPSLSGFFRSLEAKLYPFLCMLQMTISRRTTYPVPYVIREEMGTSLRSVHTSAERHRRDYRLLRDIVLLFDSIQRDYDVNFGRRLTPALSLS